MPQLLGLIRARGAKAGVALDPATPVDAVSEVWGDIDFLTIMASGPSLKAVDYRPRTVVKLQQAYRARQEGRHNLALQVEGGGVGFENLDELVGAGADILVVGSDIFQDGDPRARLQKMIRLAATSGQISSV